MHERIKLCKRVMPRVERITSEHKTAQSVAGPTQLHEYNIMAEDAMKSLLK